MIYEMFPPKTGQWDHLLREEIGVWASGAPQCVTPGSSHCSLVNGIPKLVQCTA